MLRHSPPTTSAAPKGKAAAATRKRGSYNCGRCGLPKKGHVCHSTDPAPFATPLRSDQHQIRRVLSFDEDRADLEEEVAETVVPLAVVSPPPEVVVEEELGKEDEDEVVNGVLPWWLLVEVLKRLPPKKLMAAAEVCKGWRECARRVWKSAEELRLRVPPKSQIGFVGSVLQKCAGLVRLSLRMESDVNATVLACVAFSCPNIETLEISIADTAVNLISGDELGRFVAEKRCLLCLKIEGCTNLGFLNLSSASLSILWLSDLYCISKMVINCPNLKELSLDFARQENDSTNLTTMMDSLGRTCPWLRNIHIASIQLSNAAVLALAGASLRGLRMLSLVLGSKITDASVAAIVSSFTDLELLDLSGSSISDSGIGMICSAYPKTLYRLLLALCPNITSSGIQFATAQLPLLQLIDCGMSICDVTSQNKNLKENGLQNDEVSRELDYCQKLPTRKPQPMYQKLIVKHGQLKKLSLWGCSSLDALYLNCPELSDLNLNSCTNLNPERLLLRCPNLEEVHASGCKSMLIGAIRSQIFNEFATGENHSPCKRLADGSKRVRVPHFLVQQAPTTDEKPNKRARQRQPQCTLLLVD